MELRDKVVILTGASGGIGTQIAISFAKKGARLALVGRNVDKLEHTANLCRESGSKAICIVADLCKEEDIERVVKESEDQLGPIDLLINNAGVMAFKPIIDYSAEEVHDIVMSNIYWK